MTHYVAFDLETTGVSSFLDVPVSYGFFEHIVKNGGNERIRRGGFINPGIAIPAGAGAIHGITDEMVVDAQSLLDGIEFIAERLREIWSSGYVIVGMNVSYDLTMVESLCQRLGIATLAQRGGVGPVLDVLILDRHYDKWRKGPRKLTDLCANYGVTLDSAHSAVDDAAASLEVLEAQLKQYPAIGEIPVDSINESMRAWYVEWLASFSTYLEKKGEAPISAGRYDWPIHSGE
ncbi:MAG TPA: exonuclease domain-containing protein [Acidimicrobiales bacterium]